MSFLEEVRLIVAREHPVFRQDLSVLRAAIARPGCPPVWSGQGARTSPAADAKVPA